MNKNSRIPDYTKSGGKEKELTTTKTGKPRKVNYYGQIVEGINITDDVKKQFNFAINK